MKYELPYPKKPSPEKVKSVMYRIDESDIQDAFNSALDKTGLSAQALVDSMVRHCLKDIGLYSEPKPEEPEYIGAVCRGSRALGTACGSCERCVWYAKNAKASY